MTTEHKPQQDRQESGVSSRLPEYLDMGIWSDPTSLVWLPKRFYPTRNDAKRFAKDELGHHWTETRVRTRYLRMEFPHTPDETYNVCDKNDPEGFECWEVS